MRVLVTGATGFIGSHVTRLLVAKGHDVSVLTRPGADPRRIADVLPRLRVIAGDLQGIAAAAPAIAAESPELCLHLAWYVEPGRYLDALENVDCAAGSLELLRILDEAGCRRFVGAGTCFEYDTAVGRLSETSPIRPRTLYATCKHVVSLAAAAFGKTRNRSVVWARIFYQYGPHEDPRRLVPHVIGCLARGERCPLSSGEERRGYLHVEDVASSLVAVATSDYEGAINVGASEDVSVAELAKQIAAITGRPELLRFGERPSAGDPPLVVADDSLLRRLGFHPRFTLPEGLAQTVKWWRTEGFRVPP